MLAPILVVEDDPSMTAVISRALKHRGHAVTAAPSVEAAMEVSDAFALGVFDIDLPDGDGIDLARRLLDRRIVFFAVFFSGTTDATSRGAAAELGPFVSKADGVEALADTVERTLAEAEQAAICAGAEDTPSSSGSDPRPSSRVRRRR